MMCICAFLDLETTRKQTQSHNPLANACSDLPPCNVSVAIWFQLTFGENTFNPDFIGFTFFVLFIYVIVLFAISLIPMGYCIFFVAKTIKILALKKEVRISDFKSEFVFIVFFPFGVWFLQPLINKIKNKTITGK